MLQHRAMLLRRGEYRLETDDSMFSDLRKELTNMLTSILDAQLSWYQADGWVFDPVTVGPDIIEYTLAKGPTCRTARHPALLLPAGSSGRRDHGLVRGKWRARPYHVVPGDTDDAPLRCSSCLAGQRYDRLPG